MHNGSSLISVTICCCDRILHHLLQSNKASVSSLHCQQFPCQQISLSAIVSKPLSASSIVSNILVSKFPCQQLSAKHCQQSPLSAISLSANFLVSKFPCQQLSANHCQQAPLSAICLSANFLVSSCQQTIVSNLRNISSTKLEQWFRANLLQLCIQACMYA